MARLSDYVAKRDFAKTREPRGRIAHRRGKALRFVIQKHAATRLHYDLRLELDGVYKSWAVTKVPSLDPAVKRLAVEVEDHPIEYGTFEGIIPEGEYGGGTVQLWDRGNWVPQDEGDAEQALEKGHIKFELDGERTHCGLVGAEFLGCDVDAGGDGGHESLPMPDFTMAWAGAQCAPHQVRGAFGIRERTEKSALSLPRRALPGAGR